MKNEKYIQGLALIAMMAIANIGRDCHKINSNNLITIKIQIK
jgi:hypothetical protein